MTAGSSDNDSDESGSDFIPSPYSRASLSLVTIDHATAAASSPDDTAFLLTPEVGEVRKRSFSAPHGPTAGSANLGSIEEFGDKGPMRICEAETRAAEITAGSSDDDDDESGSNFIPSPYSRASLSLVTIDDASTAAASAPVDTAFLLTPEVGVVRKRSFSAPHRPTAGSANLGTIEEFGDKGKKVEKGPSRGRVNPPY